MNSISISIFQSFIALFLLLNFQLYAQLPTQNIKGTVVDSQSEFPLMGTEILTHVQDKDYWAVTDENGEFIIENVPVGRIDISAHYTGFDSQKIKQINLVSGKELVVNFKLLEKLERIDEVIIKAKTNRESVAFVSTSSATVNIDETNQYAGAIGDISRVTMNYAGVSGNDDSRNDIIVRGNNPNSLLWMMEGAVIPSPNHYSTSGSSGGPVSMINTNTLSQSNFLSGAFPANFGNTTAAAFDLRFRNPNKDKTEFVAQIGFAGLEFGIEGPFSKKHKASYLLNYRYSTLAIFDLLGFELGLGTAVPKYQDLTAIINIPTEKLGTFKVWSIGGYSIIDFNNNSDEDENIFYNQKESLLKKENKNIISGLTHKYFFNKKTSSKISISYSDIRENTTIDTLNTVEEPPRYYRFFDDVLNTSYTTVDAKLNSKLNTKNRLSGGLSYTNYNTDFTLNSYNNDYTSSVDDNTGLASSYLNWQHRFDEDFVINTGLRYQFFTLNNQGILEPRIGIEYHLGNSTSLNLGYGLHSNINPLLSYFTKQWLTPTQLEHTNSNVSMVKSHHIIMGLKQKLGENLKIKTEIYYQYLFDVPISHKNNTYSIINSGYNSGGGSQLFFDELFNEGKGKNYGLDITLEYPLQNGFYTLLTGSLYESKYLAYDAIWRNTAWNGNFMSSLLMGKEYQIANKIRVGAGVNFNYTGGRRFTPIDEEQSILIGGAVYLEEKAFESKLPNYFRTDLKISLKRNGDTINQEWHIDLRNVFNRRNVFSQSFNESTSTIDVSYQQGFLPVVQYRLLF